MTIANAEYSQHNHDEQYIRQQLDRVSPMIAEIEEQMNDEGFVQAFVLSDGLAEYMRENGLTDIDEAYSVLLEDESDLASEFMALPVQAA